MSLYFEINPRFVPETERKGAAHIERLLASVGIGADNFASAVAMYLSLKIPWESGQVPANWAAIAGRDGGMSLFHFSISLDALRSSMNLVPTLHSKLNHALLRSISKRFRQEFPVVEALRHSIAHSAELIKNPAAVAKNFIEMKEDGHILPELWAINGANVMIQDTFIGDKFTNTIDGKIVQYELNNASADKIIQMKNDIFSVFTPFGDFVDLNK